MSPWRHRAGTHLGNDQVVMADLAVSIKILRGFAKKSEATEDGRGCGI